MEKANVSLTPDLPSLRIAVAVACRGGLVLVQRRFRRTGFVHEFPMGKAEPGEDLPSAARLRV